jgi:hypothetical protein
MGRRAASNKKTFSDNYQDLNKSLEQVMLFFD